MCGITGIVNQSNNPVDPGELNQANGLISHRGPDGEGTYFGSNFAFAHRRLSIIDLSEKASQPMFYSGNVIVFNGAIYNYIELKTQLKSKGYSFQSESDTEVILTAYDYWGADCVQYFNGMWAFAIYDKKKNRLFCSRDRFGIKPFYYTRVEDKFCFASEIKQFTKIQGWKAKINRTRVYEYLVYGYHDHTSETLFENVLQLKKGHNLIYDLDKHTSEIKNYYYIPKDQNAFISFEDAKEKFVELFRDAIQLRLRSDVKVGSALSGGLDSSSVVGVVNQVLKFEKNFTEQETVSACFPGFEKDESFWINEVAQKNKIKAHKVFPTFKNFFDDLRSLTWYQDEPVAGASLMAQHLVFKTAKSNKITVMLDGQGADEILAGYDRFYYSHLKNLFQKNIFRSVSELLGYFKLHSVHPFEALKAVSAFNRKAKSIAPNWIGSKFKVSNEKSFKRSADKTVRATSINMIYEMGLGALLHYEDRNSMAASVETRLPFLDYRLVEFCLSLPDDFKIKSAKRKYILRESMKPVLPDAVYKRFDKIGFAAPQKIWMREHKALFDQHLENAIDQSGGIINQNIKESKNLDIIWRAITFGIWMEVFGVKV